MQTLFYYYKKPLIPFRSIMDMTNPEIIEFMNLSLPQDPVFHGDPPKYIKMRKDTEKWLYKSFCQLGGKPLTPHPIYMTLGRSSYIENLQLYPDCITVPLAHFSETIISFTYPDSYVSRWLATTGNQYFNPNIHGKVFILSDLPHILSGEPCHNDAWKMKERKFDFFIEAQIWDPGAFQSIG
jgi:hypothetical protein